MPNDFDFFISENHTSFIVPFSGSINASWKPRTLSGINDVLSSNTGRSNNLHVQI